MGITTSNTNGSLTITSFSKYLMVGFVITMAVFLTYGVIDGQEQKEELSNMSCEELRLYLIETSLEFKGFPQIAEKLFKYKCEVTQ